MYTLIGTLSTRAFRVAWMLYEIGADFSVDPLPPRHPKLAALNPSLKVPILRDGDAAITDSVAICQFLADKHGKFTHPAGSIARAHQDSFTQFAVDDIESNLWTVAKHTFVLPEELRVPAVKAACRHDFDRAIAAFAERLGDRAYVMGDDFTVPDILLGHCAMWAERIGWPLAEDNVKAYAHRLTARKAFQQTVALREATQRA